MRITNKHNLPEPFVKAVTKGLYPPNFKDPRRMGVTTLIGPPKIRILRMRYWDELEEDVADRLWALFGTVGHKILEEAATVDAHRALRHIRALLAEEKTLEAIQEAVEKYFTPRDGLAEKWVKIERNGWRISGVVDWNPDTDSIDDYKFGSIWGVFPPKNARQSAEDWKKQLNVYGYAMKQETGHMPKRLRVIQFARDWARSKSLQDADYPNIPVSVHEIPIWPEELTSDYIDQRIALHEEAINGDLPDCTPEERWAKPTTWAVMAAGVKKARRVLYSLGEASAWLDQRVLPGERHKFTIDERSGGSTRCQGYCSVLPYCEQGCKLTETEGEVAPPDEIPFLALCQSKADSLDPQSKLKFAEAGEK